MITPWVPKKHKLFPSTMKYTPLRWFMSLERSNISIWDQMTNTFIKKHRGYCKAMETKDRIFRMMEGENESLEDHEEIFQLSYKKSF